MKTGFQFIQKQHFKMKNINKRLGATTKNAKAHQQEHRKWSRRNFLKNIGLAGGGAALLSGVPLAALADQRWNALTTGQEERAIVVVRLNGGNDGLNTIVPLNQYDIYANARPNLKIPTNQTWNLSDEYAMPNFMSDLQPMWQEGQMKVIHNVGYAEQNLSHFRSTDIWESASDADQFIASGWLGRWATNQYPDLFFSPPDYPVAIQIGAYGSIAYNNDDLVNIAFSVTNPQELESIAENGELYDPAAVNSCYSGEQLGFLRAITNNTFKYSEVLPEVYANGANDVQYLGKLGGQLGVIARLIKGGLQTKMYLVSIGGFDTHANQTEEHQDLLNQVSSQIKLFFDDLAATNKDQDVLLMTVSEFGRRIEENGSQGTDHGAAAPMMLFSPGINANGFIGSGTDLNNVDEIGNLNYEIDFRSVYASVLEKWLCVDPLQVDSILGASFDRLDLGFDCNSTSIFTPKFLTPNIDSQVRYLDSGHFALHYTLPYSGDVTIDLFNAVGQPMQKLFSGYQSKGAQIFPFYLGFRYPASTYIIRVTLNGRGVSKKVQLIR